MKKVLIISHNFPPAGGVGVIRIVKFLKFLKEFGWQPVVLTSNGYTAIKDPSLLKEIPKNTTIYRVNYSDPARVKNPFLKSIWMYYLSPFFCFPDGRSLWVKKAYSEAIEIVKKEKIDLIFSSSYPISSHLVAYKLKEKTGIKWVADFRDEWATNPESKLPTIWHRNFARKWEKILVKSADRVVTVSRPLAQYFEKISGRNIDVITNGYDSDDFFSSSYRKQKRFKILHAGTIYGSAKKNLFQEAFDELNLKNASVEFLGGKKRVTHRESCLAMQKADVLLLILSHKFRPGVYSTKLFEYLAAKRPILAIAGQETEAAKLIKANRIGTVASPQNKEEIKKAILKLYKLWQKDELIIPNLDFSRFDRQNLTRELVSIFDSLKSRPLKICVVANAVSPQNEKMCRFLLKRGHEIHFINLSKGKITGAKNYFIKQDIKKSFWPLFLMKGLFNKINAHLKIRKIISQIKPDIVHGHGVNFAGILAVYSGFHPVIVTTRGSDIMQSDRQIKPEQYLIRQTLKKADIVTGSSVALKNRAVALGMPKEKFEQVVFGVDMEIFKPFDTQTLRTKLKLGNKKVIFCPRSINRIYNTDILVEAFNQLPHENLVLIFTDQNMNEQYFDETVQPLIKKYQLEKNIRILPRREGKDLATLYNLADVVVSLASSDGLAVSFLEAMACQKKIVITDVDFTKEWFEKDNFWIVPVRDKQKTAKALKEALKYPDSKFGPVGSSNRQMVADRAEINKGFEKLEHVYRTLV